MEIEQKIGDAIESIGHRYGTVIALVFVSFGLVSLISILVYVATYPR